MKDATGGADVARAEVKKIVTTVHFFALL